MGIRNVDKDGLSMLPDILGLNWGNSNGWGLE